MLDSNRVTPILAAISTVVAVISTIVTLIINGRVQLLDQSVRKADANLKAAIEKRTERQTEQELSLKIYEKVYAALEANDTRKHRVALALVQSLEDDKPLKKYLLVLLQTDICGQRKPVRTETAVRAETEETEELCKRAGVSIFNIEEQPTTQPTTGAEASASKAIDYDVFWCEKDSTREQLANAAATILRRRKEEEKDATIGRVRVRILPDDVNRERRFLVVEPTIRFDKQGEENLAKNLKSWIDPVLLDVKGSREGFKILPNTTGTPTPGYLSAYVCGVPDAR